MNRVARAGALIVVAALATGCSGGSDASSTTTPTTSTTSAPAATTPTTVAATPPPPPSTTPTTATPTTVPATTAPPATLPTDVEQIKHDVIAVATVSWQYYHDAIRDPADEAKLARLPEVVSGPKLQLMVENIADVVARGVIIAERPNAPGPLAFYEDTFTVDPSAGTASIEFCRIGSDFAIEPGGNPDGTDKVVVDEINAYHERSEFVFVDGRWFDNGGIVIQKYEDSAECVPT